MTIITKFNLTQRVTWYSYDIGDQCTGTIIGIVIEQIKDHEPDTVYHIDSDKNYKTSRRHIINERDKQVNLKSI
jgi:hypothetical protein